MKEQKTRITEDVTSMKSTMTRDFEELATFKDKSELQCRYQYWRNITSSKSSGRTSLHRGRGTAS